MKEIDLLTQDGREFANQKRPDVLMVLKRKLNTQRDWIFASFKEYQFTEEESQIVQQALLKGDLRTTDFLKRPLSHYIWSFLTFKWGEILAGGKRLSKQEVLQIASLSSNGHEFKRTPSQDRDRLIKGVPLVIGKVITSMALCMVFCLGLLSTLGAPFVLSLSLAIVLSLCNGTVCLLSRGQAMLDSAGFQPKKQKTSPVLEENLKQKSLADHGQKLFFGVVTLLACISAGISGYAGLVGLLTFLGAGTLVANPFVLVATVGLSVIAAISFYSFQAVGIRENYVKFKNLFIEDYKKSYGLLRCILLGAVSTVFLSVYATLTWFTAVSGVNKLFYALGVNSNTSLARTLSIICTLTTMVVNTFSQVYKVFNPKTYVDLKEKLASIRLPQDEHQSRAQKIKSGAMNILKLFALIGDSLAYSVAGGIRSGIHIGETLGESIGAKLTLTITMAILSPVILVFVSIAFTWPAVFQKNKSIHNLSEAEKPLLKQSIEDTQPLPNEITVIDQPSDCFQNSHGVPFFARFAAVNQTHTPDAEVSPDLK